MDVKTTTTCDNHQTGTMENFDLITFLINNSPLTKYHILICPNRLACHPQILTKAALKFSINFLFGLNDYRYRIGYNSPGALASVNHYHLHLLHIEHHLFVERVVGKVH